jgi:hypothetical protein
MPKRDAQNPREIRSPIQVVVRLALLALMVFLLLGLAVAAVRLLSRPAPAGALSPAAVVGARLAPPPERPSAPLT